MPFIGNKPASVPLTSADITDGIIVNADINAFAAIASSKLTINTPLTVVGNATAGSSIRLPEDTDNGSNYVALKAPDSLSSDLTFTLPSADGTSGQVIQTNGSGTLSFATVGATAGQVIQVVTATDSTQRSTTSGTYVTGSNTLSASITPSSTANKILILLYTIVARNDGNTAYYTIYRGGSNLFTANGIFYLERGDDIGNDPTPFCFQYLDSPSTTSSTTYQVYFKVGGGGTITGYLNYTSLTNSITLMEIKG